MTDYEEHGGHVVVANNEAEVVFLCKIEAGRYENPNVWDKAEITEEGIYTGNKTKPFIILNDFNNA